MNFLAKLPTKCWSCLEERRHRLTHGFPRNVWRDHWVVVCTSTSNERITFDYWSGAPPAENVRKFYDKYPIPGAPPDVNDPNEIVNFPQPRENPLSDVPVGPVNNFYLNPY